MEAVVPVDREWEHAVVPVDREWEHTILGKPGEGAELSFLGFLELKHMLQADLERLHILFTIFLVCFSSCH